MNIERYLTEHHQGTHRQISQLLRQGRVTLNDAVIMAGHIQVDPGDQVRVDGLTVVGRQPQYLIVNKPVGVSNDLTPTVAHSLGSLLNVLDQQRQLGVIADLPKDAAGIVLLSDDHHFLDDVRQVNWPSTLTVQLTGTTPPAALQNPLWQVVTTATNDRQHILTVTVRTNQVAPALTALAKLPQVIGAVTRTALGPVTMPVDLPAGTYRGLPVAQLDAVVAPLDDQMLDTQK